MWRQFDVLICTLSYLICFLKAHIQMYMFLENNEYPLSVDSTYFTTRLLYISTIVQRRFLFTRTWANVHFHSLSILWYNAPHTQIHITIPQLPRRNYMEGWLLSHRWSRPLLTLDNTCVDSPLHVLPSPKHITTPNTIKTLHKALGSSFKVIIRESEWSKS